MTDRLMTGDCRWLDKGAEVVRDQTPIFSDSMCVRLKGEYECLWINKGMFIADTASYQGSEIEKRNHEIVLENDKKHQQEINSEQSETEKRNHEIVGSPPAKQYTTPSGAYIER